MEGYVLLGRCREGGDVGVSPVGGAVGAMELAAILAFHSAHCNQPLSA